MSELAVSPGQRLLDLWRKTSSLPMGRKLFMWLFGQTVPYSAALGARVVDLEPGFCRVQLRERRSVQNHLNSVHAVALANLGELTSGLAMTTALPTGVRAIVTQLTIAFEKKARGVLIAESRVEVPEVRSDIDHQVRAEIRDAAGDSVATVTVQWRLGPVPSDS